MAKKKEKGTLSIPYAMDRETGAAILLKASGVIQQDAIFYDKEKHKGHLTCPKCERPDVYAIVASEVAGSKKARRDHFARFPEQQHDAFCEWNYMGEERGDPRTINYDKGGYFYLNTGKLPDRPPYKDIFKRVSSRISPAVELLPAWIRAINYEKNSHGYDSIANDDFKDRPRLRAISTAADYLDIIRSIPSEKLKDTWVINRAVAVRLDSAILRVSLTPYAPRTAQEMIEQRQRAGLLPSFLMAANAQYDRFAALLNTETDRIKHPVLLHFKVGAKPKEIRQNSTVFWRIRLEPFDIENPERRKTHPHQLALPCVKVYPMVNIYDRSLLKKLQPGAEFFAIAHPNLSIKDESRPNRTYFQHFNILRPCDIIQMSQQELSDSIKKTAQERSLRSGKPLPQANAPRSIPA